MDIKKFFRLLNKYKWLFISIPILTLLVTYFFVKKLPKEYKSQAKLSTGLLDPSRQVVPETPNYSGPDLLIKINQQFANIMDIMQMPRNMSILSYRLILHDLKNPAAPFKEQSDDVKALTASERAEAIRLFEERLANKTVLTPLDNYKVKLYNLVKSMGYDAKSLSKKLNISHEQNSDFVSVEFTSENTFMSVFVVNTLAKDFIKNYSEDLISNKTKSIVLLDSLVKQKEAAMNQKIDLLKEYRIKNRVLNLDKQSQIVYQQIVDYENKKSQALIDLQAMQAALSSVNSTLNNRDNEKYLGAEHSSDNQKTISIKNKLQQAEEQYIDKGFRQTDKKIVDSLRQLLSSQLSQSVDNYVSDPLVAKQSLILRRVSLTVDIDKTRASIADINQELSKLNSKFNQMVPYDAGVQKYERDADIATKEFMELLNRYNLNNLDKNIGLRLQLEQEGTPSAPEPSKKIIFMALSGIASLAICFALLFVMATLDFSINNRKQLTIATKGKVLGELNFIKSKWQDIDEIWKDESHRKDYLNYKNLLRALRFEIDEKLASQQANILGVTSLHPEKFKVFCLVSMAYAFARTDKQILIIGDDETANEVQRWNIPINQSLKSVLDKLHLDKNNRITFLNKDLGGVSLLENSNKEKVQKVFDYFKTNFDLVLVFLDPLNIVSDVNEWVLFTDSYLATYMAGNSLSELDKESIRHLANDQKFMGWVINGVKGKYS